MAKVSPARPPYKNDPRWYQRQARVEHSGHLLQLLYVRIDKRHLHAFGGVKVTNMTKREECRKGAKMRKEMRAFRKDLQKTDAVGRKTRFVRALRARCPGMRITRSTITTLMEIMTQLSVDHFSSMRCMLGGGTLRPVDVYRHHAILSTAQAGVVSLIRCPATALADKVVQDMRASQYTASINGDQKVAEKKIAEEKKLHMCNLGAMVSDTKTMCGVWKTCAAAGIHPQSALDRADIAVKKAISVQRTKGV